ncbi:unnamed protein product [Linum trigynum]|uniref:Uncharacterized protein n=1 Tax=Linum trigynum TaxID=586398 RepID=A0AAV2EUU2_9ROSI
MLMDDRWTRFICSGTATTDGRERGRMEAAARGDEMRTRSGRGGCARWLREEGSAWRRPARKGGRRRP